jgi:F-type H+/Na+-transporting ATPase subunit alpha
MTWLPQLEAVLRNLDSRATQSAYQIHVEDIGRVRSVGDGVAHVMGLAEATLDEVVVFAGGVRGHVLDLGRDEIGCILHGSDEGVEAGSQVIRTGQVVGIPVGPALLGRAVNALGQPLDGRGPLETTEEQPIEREPPGVLQRQPVHEPLLTGIKVIDAAIPIGLGQRELILGDRETGKTSIVLDAIINQRETGVICIYASIGSKRASVRELIEELRRAEALDHTILVVADAAEPASLRYLAPYAAATIAEWFAYRGQHALIVYDDLTRHAEAYRTLSLLLRRSPSREAYPGDIFYVHARLMERAFKLSAALGGGSVTALPILETQRGNFAGFIPSNLISMTDGQVYLDPSLAAQGQLPAVDIGRSVSRVGGSAQPALMREAAANLRLDLAQYAEVRGFARFGALLDDTTRRQLEYGQRLSTLLRQPERRPLPMLVQVAELWALKTGLLDTVASESLPALEERLRTSARQVSHLADELLSTDVASDPFMAELTRWVQAAITGVTSTVAPVEP